MGDEAVNTTYIGTIWCCANMGESPQLPKQHQSDWQRTLSFVGEFLSGQ
jgi:hypothetical protein